MSISKDACEPGVGRGQDSGLPGELLGYTYAQSTY